jgi:hypothetical protein
MSAHSVPGLQKTTRREISRPGESVRQHCPLQPAPLAVENKFPFFFKGQCARQICGEKVLHKVLHATHLWPQMCGMQHHPAMVENPKKKGDSRATIPEAPGSPGKKLFISRRWSGKNHR